jgi:hypothetical protein
MRQCLLLVLLSSVLAHAGDLEGRVVEDHTGNPLASVEVRVYRIGQRTLAAELETDGEGRFRAPGLPDGDYRIEASKANFIGATLRLQNASAGLLMRLVRCGVITGQIADAQGAPIPGAAVYAISKPADGGPLRPFSTLGQWNYVAVDARGQYRLHGLPPGEYAVAVSYGASTATFGSHGGAVVRAGLGSGVQVYPSNQRPQFFTVSGGEQYRNIDFVIQPAALHTLSGRVQLPEAKTRYWLALIAPDQPAIATAVAEADFDGAFRFTGVPAGSYTLTASGPINGYGGKGIVKSPPFFGRMPVTLAADVDGVSMTVQPGRTVSFLLRAAGQPGAGGCPPKASIAVNSLEDFAVKTDRTADIDSTQSTPVPNLAPAQYRVVASGLGEFCYQSSEAVLDLSAGGREGPVLVTVAAAGAIRGKLGGTARPAEFAVALASADPENNVPLQMVYPGADGKFAFGGLRPGRYRIAAHLKSDKARWVTGPGSMIEIQVAGGSPTDLELPVAEKVEK